MPLIYLSLQYCASRVFVRAGSRVMRAVTIGQVGGIGYPPIPTFYPRPRSIVGIIRNIGVRPVKLCDVQVSDLPRWRQTITSNEQRLPGLYCRARLTVLAQFSFLENNVPVALQDD